MKVQLLSENPEIVLFGDFLSREEADGLIALAEGHFENSKVVCDKRGGCVSSYRTSATAYLPQTELTRAVAERGMRLARLPFAENLQIVRYFPGQEFKPHLDAFDPGTAEGRTELASYGGRQRDATFLVYLNEGMGGGATRFEKLGLEVKPSAGAALYWKNVGLDGRVDGRTLHQGLPVTSGVKYAVNLWIRGSKALAGYPCPPRVNRVAALRSFVPVPVRLGKIGEPRPMPEAPGVKVEREVYKGTGPTLLKMASFIREGSVNPAMKQFAEMVVRQAGVASSDHLTNQKAAQILLNYVKKNVRYRPDPNNVEMVQSAAITLCVPGAAMCIPVEDCDGMVIALGSLMGAYGIPVKIMKQSFGDDVEEEHVLVIFETDDKRWLAADPTAPLDVGVGFRASAAKEETIDPLDPMGSGSQASEFVSVGKKPHFKLLIGGAAMKETLKPRRVLLGSASDAYVQSLQQTVNVQVIRTAVIVEDCSSLDQGTKSSWDSIAQRAIAFMSSDPSNTSPDEGKAVIAAINDFNNTLVAKGCVASAAELPAAVPPLPPTPGTDWEGLAKLGLYTLMLGVGAYALSEVVKIAEIGTMVLPKHHEAAAEAKRLMRRTG